MARDDIIRMAREAGFNEIQTNAMVFGAILERFAALVAAAEREAMIEQGWRQCAKGQRTTQFCGMVEQAVLAEREACAKVCDVIDDGRKDLSADCAAAIRARGNK